jgi:hypothetical protein
LGRGFSLVSLIHNVLSGRRGDSIAEFSASEKATNTSSLVSIFHRDVFTTGRTVNIAGYIPVLT